MRCPHCTVELKTEVHRHVQMDRCPRCGGLWFDCDELARFNRFDSDFPLRREAKTSGQMTSLKCPRCGSILSRIAYTHGGSVYVDRCISCKGVWLDRGEIETIRGILTKKLRMNRARRKLDEATRREQELWEAHMNGVAEEESQQSVSRMEWFFMFVTRLPLEVYNPVRRFPAAVVALIVANVLIFALEYYVLDFRTVLSLAFVPNSLRQLEQLHGLVTSMFLHGSVLHIAGNVYFLYTFGDNVEDFFGPLKFLVLYFLCGLSANLVHFSVDVYSQAPALGASGAISGILAAYMLVFPRRKIYWFVIIWPVKLRAIWYGLGWAALQIVNAAIGGSSVAWFAHIGGFIAGIALTKGYTTYMKLQPAITDV